MTGPQPIVGFDRKIELRWLDTVAAWDAAGLADADIITAFDDLLATIDQGAEANRKNRTVLTAVWLRHPDGQAAFHAMGLDLFTRLDPAQRIALHWGKCMATYPFFAFVAQHTGRLLRLQGDVTNNEVRRRVVAQYGDTERIRRSARHVTQTLHDWATITLVEKGRYTPADPVPVSTPALESWLIEAYLHAGQGPSGGPMDILANPVYFPFTFAPLNAAQLERANPRLEVVQHGMSTDFITLRQHSPRTP